MRLFEYEAPKDDNFKNYESTKQFVSRYFLLFPFAAYAFYNMMFVVKNKISKKCEWKIVSKGFEK